jgi:hypothetical protein
MIMTMPPSQRQKQLVLNLFLLPLYRNVHVVVRGEKEDTPNARCVANPMAMMMLLLQLRNRDLPMSTPLLSRNVHVVERMVKDLIRNAKCVANLTPKMTPLPLLQIGKRQVLQPH